MAFDTTQPGQIVGLGEYEYDPVFTVGETIEGYAPPGILDGIGAFELDENTVRVLANHELRTNVGYTYELANGTQLQGARVSYFDINKETFEIEDAGLAYDTIINRQGEVVDDPTDLEFEGINRLCSSIYIEPQQFGDGIGLEDGIYFTGEESFQGTEFALDPSSNTLYAAPWMGRAAWENVTELNTGSTEKVAILVGDDREAAPLLMYVGEKDRSEGAGFLERNGLVGGKVYAWVPDGEVGDTPEFVNEDGEVIDADTAPDPFGFNGTGNSLSGSWVELDHYRPDLASEDGSTGYDADGFATQEQQDALFIEAGGFQFSRPEDVATNPEDGTQAVLASTGRGNRFSGENWGTTYVIESEFDENGDPVSADVSIVYDGNDAGNGQFEHPDFGLRSPDNLDWADDGNIYIQEDRSTVERVPRESLDTDEVFPDAFGGVSREEASIWELDPNTGELTRIAQVDRSAVPDDQIDTDPDDLGDWETSGILDVSTLFGQEPGSLLIADTQSHSLRGGPIGDPEVDSDDPTSDDQNLVQGGQLGFFKAVESFKTDQPEQVQSVNDNGYLTDAIFTVGETIEGYAPPGILDGIGAFELDENTVRVLANHELRTNVGYTYELANGTQLQGARVSYFDINKETFEIEDAGLAYDTIINRQGEVVDDPTDLEFEGINRLCSSIYIEPQQFGDGIGLEDGIYFTGEESFQGTEFALDPSSNTLYAAPWMGRAAWENVTELNTGSTEKVAILVGDDREAAPLLMYVGEKDRSEGAGFLERNGLVGGKVYAWVPDGEVGDTPEFVNEDGEVIDADTAPDPFGFNGTGNSLSGSWVELDHYRPDLASEDGSTGYDADGFATQEQQDALFIEAGGFQFSRPEDVATNPEDGTQAVLASTGRGNRFSGENWGTTYVIESEFDENGDPVSADVSIVYDGNDAGNGQFEHPDFGLRSPDNLDWADDGNIYIQEDRSTVERVPRESLDTDEVFPDAFGGVSREEASIWELDPNTGELTRIAQVDRSAVPDDQIDTDPDDLGDWETSGILDVSTLFGQEPGSLLIADTQSHSLRGGPIGDPEVDSDDPTSDDQNLVQGGQLFFITEAVEGTSGDDILTGLNIAQTIAGDAGNDTIFGGDSDDVLRGDANSRSAGGSEGGDDVIFGGAGDDRIGGKAGNDELHGDEGDDAIFGDDGDDILRGGLGDDILTGDDNSGGVGADTFILAEGDGTDTITDFEVGIDIIGLAEGLTFADLSISGNTISVGDETLATVLGVETLTEADFTLV